MLGLLSIRPSSTYELARSMSRSLHFIWPRAESNLYAEPKRLVEADLATAEIVWTGDRKRTVYSITPKGTTALREWLKQEPASQRIESEPAVRVLFGNLGSKDDLLAAITRIAADADESITELSDLSDQYARGEGRFPERIHVNALLLALMIEQARVAARWAEWATGVVKQWPDTTTPDVEWAVHILRRLIEGEPVSNER
jgi:PadR family transcriptional regulator, regulatory protein AphA